MTIYQDVGPVAYEPPGTYSIHLAETLLYDRATGEVQTLVGDVVREAIKVRRSLQDAVVLEAVVAELRRRGYTVIRPEEGSP